MTRSFYAAALGLILAGGCASGTGASSGQAAAPAANPLEGTRWELVQFQPPDRALGARKPSDPTLYNVEFLAGGRFAMRLDCNRAMGQWVAKPTSATGGSLTFTGPAMTRAACLRESMDTQIGADLTRVRAYALQGDTLDFILMDDGGVYTWRRKTQ